MKSKRPCARYAILFVVMFVLDRITKFLMVRHGIGQKVITPFLSFDLYFNRGMSWGILHSEHTAQFVFVSFLTITIIVLLTIYAFRQWQQGFSIWGEVLALTGAVSNLIDRVWYGGVVDFISLSYRGWSWPVFNIADACVVIGIFLMIIGFSREG